MVMMTMWLWSIDSRTLGYHGDKVSSNLCLRVWLCLPLLSSRHVCMAACSNEVTKNAKNAMLMLKWEGLGWRDMSLSEAVHLLINMCWGWPKESGAECWAGTHRPSHCTRLSQLIQHWVKSRRRNHVNTDLPPQESKTKTFWCEADLKKLPNKSFQSS